MRTTVGTIAGLAAGLVTSLLTAAICLALERYLQFGFFTLMIMFIIPAGAAITGFAASSGYYLGAKLFDARPNWIMALGMVAIAGLTQGLIYFGIYAILTLPDGRRVMDLVDYWTFVKVYLGNQRYTIGHSSGSGIEVGNAGYAIAALQFLGFLAGGGFTFVLLKRQTFCEKCERYFRARPAVSKKGSAEHIDGLRAKPVLSPDYFGALPGCSRRGLQARRDAVPVSGLLARGRLGAGPGPHVIPSDTDIATSLRTGRDGNATASYDITITYEDVEKRRFETVMRMGNQGTRLLSYRVL